MDGAPAGRDFGAGGARPPGHEHDAKIGAVHVTVAVEVREFAAVVPHAPRNMPRSAPSTRRSPSRSAGQRSGRTERAHTRGRR